jgi:hypothetical protein
MADSGKSEVLFQFLQCIHSKTIFKQDREQIADLEQGVKKMIEKIIDVYYSKSKYDFDKLIHVGSSFEGSKIISPNEFDFMLVLKGLSEPGKVFIEPGCQPGMKLLRYKKFKRKHMKGPNLVLNNMLGLEIDSLMTSSDEKRAKYNSIRIQTSLGELRIKNMFRYTLHLECISQESSFDIDVDLMPSVRIPPDSKEIMKDIMTCPVEIKDLAFKDGCFLVGKFCIIDGMCWQLSFAAAERNMMKSLSPGHMKIYRVLKYLFVEKSIIGICDLMSSYVLKTAVLRHAYFECDNNSKPTTCFIAIIRSLSISMESAFMKSLFLPSLNLWQRVIHEKMRNITENETICEKSVKEQLSEIIRTEGKGLKYAVYISVIFEFWKRIFILLACLFEKVEDGTIHFNSMENALRIIYTKLNEEDEEDDIVEDYFQQDGIATDDKVLHDNDWNITKSQTKSDVKETLEHTTVSSFERNENTCKMDGTHADSETTSEKIDVEGECEDVEEESQDLRDIEQFVNDYVKETGEHFESDEEWMTDTDDSYDDISEISEDELFVQAHQEDVYEMYGKHGDVIRTIDIPVFSTLLQQISDLEQCMPIQRIVEQFNEPSGSHRSST